MSNDGRVAFKTQILLALITNQKPKIRNVFLCHRCAGEFDSREDRSTHKCLSDLIIEEIQGNFSPDQPDSVQAEPTITFPDDSEIVPQTNLPPLEQLKEDPKALKILRYFILLIFRGLI